MDPPYRNQLALILADIDQLIALAKVMAKAPDQSVSRIEARICLEEMKRARKSVEKQLKALEKSRTNG